MSELVDSDRHKPDTIAEGKEDDDEADDTDDASDDDDDDDLSDDDAGSTNVLPSPSPTNLDNAHLARSDPNMATNAQPSTETQAQ